MGNDNLERNLTSAPKKFSRLCTFKRQQTRHLVKIDVNGEDSQ
jgi:hypothetical protein